MGQSQPMRDTNHTELSDLNNDLEEYYDEFIEVDDCCGFERKKIVKRHLLWEDNLIKYCLEMKDYYKWTQEIAQTVKTKKLPRKKYIQEMNELKYSHQKPLEEQSSILLSPSEIEEFKKNLKKSVLLSFAYANRPSRPKQNSRIQTNIRTPSKLTRPGSRLRSDLYIEEFGKSTTGGKDRGYRSSQKSGFRNSIMNMVDDTMSTMFGDQDKEISRNNAKALETFIMFTVMLEKHLKDPGNKIYHVIQTFYGYLYRNYKKEFINSVEMENLTNSIKIFLVLLRDTVEDFYHTRTFIDEGDDSMSNYLITNCENILTIVTAIFFKDEKFSKFLFEIVQEFNKEREEEYQKSLQRLLGKTPQFFEVKKQYCLNLETIKKFINEIPKQSLPQNLQQCTFSPPYARCSDCLEGLARTKTPISKMKVIMECFQTITKCISQFYASNQIQTKHEILDADQILSIFCYLLTVIKLKDLHSHMFIIEHFATDYQLISATGYSYSVLNCAIEQVEHAYANMSQTDDI